jgi:hypothetical protein
MIDERVAAGAMRLIRVAESREDHAVDRGHVFARIPGAHDLIEQCVE